MTLVLGMGARTVEFGGHYLGEMADSTPFLEDRRLLHQRLQRDGYVLLRGVIPREPVFRARDKVLRALAEHGLLASGLPIELGRAATKAEGVMWRDKPAIAQSAELLGAVEAPELFGFFERFFEGEVATTRHKWLRAQGPGAYTGAHMDVVYMGRGTHNLVTTWIPITESTREMGPLAILEGSHRIESLSKVRATYGKMDVDRDHVTGWFTNDPIELVDRSGARWLTTEFRPGDMLIFTIFTWHMSLTNSTDRYRISCDVRWQRSDEPMDPRWFGDKPLGHYAWEKGPTKPMSEARQEWGV
ncbi:MAG TPA: phytanoyl-CoA dioxygenase family protein [Polyangiaceae bacterium]